MAAQEAAAAAAVVVSVVVSVYSAAVGVGICRLQAHCHQAHVPLHLFLPLQLPLPLHLPLPLLLPLPLHRGLLQGVLLRLLRLVVVVVQVQVQVQVQIGIGTGITASHWCARTTRACCNACLVKQRTELAPTQAAEGRMTGRAALGQAGMCCSRNETRRAWWHRC